MNEPEWNEDSVDEQFIFLEHFEVGDLRLCVGIAWLDISSHL